MEINVAQLLQSSIGTTRAYEVNEIIEMADGNGDGPPVKGKVRLIRTNLTILVEGALSTEAELTCSRCLTTFTIPLSLHFEEEYSPTIDMLTGMPLPPPEDASAFTIDDHHILDLNEAIRQYTILAIPIKPLCRQDCAGICPQCGHNLNEGPCACPVQEIDPRWAKLTNMISR